MAKRYYSVRNGGANTTITLDFLKDIFESIYEDFKQRGYFDQYFGSECVDNGFVAGKAGENVEAYVLRKLRKNNLWPIPEKYKEYSEADLFDVIEFLYDHISMPLKEDAYYHSYGNCGYHYKNFNRLAGQLEFMQEINQFLNDYGVGYELNDFDGEILSLAKEPEMRRLLEMPVPKYEDGGIDERIGSAIRKFRKYGSTLDDRTEAVRALADCLEYLRPKLKTVLASKDDDALFNIANNFGIRHHNEKQQANYDKNIWLSWMFYFYLATLYACLHFINKQKKGK